MKWRKVINKPVSLDENGTKVVGGVNAVVNANVGEPGAKTAVSSKQSIRVRQRDGRTEVTETTSRSERAPE